MNVHTVQASVAGQNYPLVIGPGACSLLLNHLQNLSAKPVLFVDSCFKNKDLHFSPDFTKILTSFDLYCIDGGLSSKSIHAFAAAIDWLISIK